VILGLLIDLVAPAALRQLGGARISVARQSIERIGGVLDLYRLDVGLCPATDQGLAALVERQAGVTTWNARISRAACPWIRGTAPTPTAIRLSAAGTTTTYAPPVPTTRPVVQYAIRDQESGHLRHYLRVAHRSDRP
jgi:hypothetical protein